MKAMVVPSPARGAARGVAPHVLSGELVLENDVRKTATRVVSSQSFGIDFLWMFDAGIVH